MVGVVPAASRRAPFSSFIPANRDRVPLDERNGEQERTKKTLTLSDYRLEPPTLHASRFTFTVLGL